MVEGRLERGEAIPGSRLYRDYCARCTEPIRVPADKILIYGRVNEEAVNYCIGCDENIERSPIHKAEILSANQRSVMFRQSDKDI